MTRAPLFAWLCLVVWAVWLFALQGGLALSGFGRWTPDVGVVLLIALTARVSSARARWAAAWVALARISYGGDPPLAVLAGYLGFVGLCHVVRSAVELERPLVRALLCGLSAALLAWFWSSAHGMSRSTHGVDVALASFAWTSALSTALVALACGGWLGALPGLSPLWTRRRML